MKICKIEQMALCVELIISKLRNTHAYAQPARTAMSHEFNMLDLSIEVMVIISEAQLVGVSSRSNSETTTYSLRRRSLQSSSLSSSIRSTLSSTHQQSLSYSIR